ncbi:MAG: hypothetical protein JSU06_13005 [Actinobacteria bacterium]|nr:hypothetical protein [Actinomycetota bacterium]
MLIATALFLYLRLRTELDNRIDQSLEARLELVSTHLEEGNGGAAAITRAVTRGGEGGGFVQIILPGSGTAVGAREGLGDEPILGGAELAHLAQDGGTVDLQSGQPELGAVRVVAAPVTVGTHRYIVAVAAALEQRNEALSNVRTLLLIGGPIALALAALAGWVVIGAALRPVDRMLVRLEEGLRRERTFVADASHELRTPLTMLRMELELMRRERPGGEELDAALDAAIGDTDRLSTLSEDLLTLARADRDRLTLGREEIDVGALLAAVAGRYPAEEVGVGGAPADAAITVDGDRTRLERALGNLVDNALAHGAPPVTLAAIRRPGAVELHVTDSGPGFPPDFLPHAFDRFSQAAPGDGGGGTGLGLAIVRAVAEAHGGSAGAGNAPAGGADTWLSLPT